jgi:hypothetical protein
MPSLEILDIGRNKIQLLPVDPGTLVNLRVSDLFQLSCTRLTYPLRFFHSLKTE